jgi:hypothetical protein
VRYPDVKRLFLMVSNGPDALPFRNMATYTDMRQPGSTRRNAGVVLVKVSPFEPYL